MFEHLNNYQILSVVLIGVIVIVTVIIVQSLSKNPKQPKNESIKESKN